MVRMQAVILFLLMGISAVAQKKPLDHSVYDSWQSIGEKLVSADGRFIAYVINLQEGDGELVIRSVQGDVKKQVPRGYQVSFTNDSRFLVALIRPFFKETRQARIRKTASTEMPRDSLVIIDLVKDTLLKIAGVKSYKIPERGDAWLAVQFWKPTEIQKPSGLDSVAQINRLLARADSLARMADSIRKKANMAISNRLATLAPVAASKTTAKPAEDIQEEGTELVLRNLLTGALYRHQLVTDYHFNKYGQVLVLECSGKKGDGRIVPVITWRSLQTGKVDTVMRNFHDAKGFAITESGSQLAFVAERDSTARSLRRYYKAWRYQPGMDSAVMIAGPSLSVTDHSYIIQPGFNNYFSKDGSRLFIGLSPDQPVKDTNLVDFETAKLDLWNYRDDYLQPQQLIHAGATAKKSWLAMVDLLSGKLVRLANDSCETVFLADEGNAAYALGLSTKGYRIQQQWTQRALSDMYSIQVSTGLKQPVARKVAGSSIAISPAGNYIYWYDLVKRQWNSYCNLNGQQVVLSRSIPFPLFDEDDDHPDDPPAYGLMGWSQNDSLAYVYDRYDIWACDPTGKNKPISITNGLGRKHRIELRYINLQPENKFVDTKKPILLHLAGEESKGESWQVLYPGRPFQFPGNGEKILAAARFDGAIKARDADRIIYRRQDPSAQDVYLSGLTDISDPAQAIRISNLNPQQADYNWYTVELRRWKMFTGKMSEGLLYKPENFDSTKKYPVIFYFYERNAGNRYNYIEPMPVRASINIAWYVSNGYIVFDPNIYYTTGQPGEDAYNSVVSAAKYLAGFRWVDKTRMGLQGHSWGGYQVAYLVTRTNLFAAAEAGAPVSNMTSAYGGIRWGTGISRQFQYEKTQSRLGATLWQHPELYIKNSPLFRADKINTPLLILHNDKDDAVPWYQGIELFTALRRLNRPAWMAVYNDELHGLTERRNRKDWTIRMAQFFDHYLKGAPEPRWMSAGIPAEKKGIDWGLDD